jgi:phospholipase C
MGSFYPPGPRRAARPRVPEVDRRTVLGAALAVAGSTLAGVAGALGGAPRAGAAPARGLGPGGVLLRPGSRPFPHLPAGTDTIPKIEHIVVLMMENHSFDDHLGTLGRGDGLTPGRDGRPVNYNPDPAGGFVRSFHNPNTVGYADNHITQSWNASHLCWDHGTNMGFVAACGAASMGYWTGADLPFYHSLATHFPIADRYFCSVMAQTYPNRRFLIAGTALGDVSTNASGISPTDAPNGTIFDRLDEHGISWKNYYPDVPTCALFLPVFERNLHNGKVVHFEQFLADARAGALPAFALIDPYTQYSEEGNDVTIGEAYAATMIDAVLSSPAWERTALIWTYDEHGGWYDHVPPVPAVRPDAVPPEITPADQPGAYDRTGFRVPCAVVSAWARRDHVSHVVYDHTSILKLLETKWNLPALTYRDANAHDMLDLFDLRAPSPPFAEPPALAAPANPFRGPLPPSSGDTGGFHPIATAVPGDGPPPGARQATPPRGAAASIARHAHEELSK